MIRLLDPDDIEAFQSIRLEALRLEPASFASSVEDWEKLPDEEWRRRITGNSVFVAFDGERPIGLMGLMRERSSKMAHRATVVMVYVQKSHRGTGVSTKLLDKLITYARENGIRQLELSASVENPAALRFYRNEGFREIGRIRGGFLHEGREIDEILMVRRIAP
ncbi:N-acetyltransferase family protein [Mesorhizobium sp. 1B3]|uniref:GNAT family N-acetyltransferase n=1 Tax=Mesorhizobium sp. 1B3 TaxID=3243599 RepID=UPI003D967368